MKILLTAGPTREPIDPVRYLTNRSSGKMGYGIAKAARHRGHQVLLISGPTTLGVPDGVDFLPVETAEEMYEAVANHLAKYDVGIFTAAVADYTPADPADQKVKKSGEELTLTLRKTKDILGSARTELEFQGTLIGFAAETQDVERYARGKLERKGCDLVVANDVSQQGVGFDSDENEILLVFPDHTERLPRDSKDHLGFEIIEQAEHLAAMKSDL